MQLSRSEAVYAKVFSHEVIDSTNAELARLDIASLEEFSAVIAQSQTLGKGRLGRSWQSPPGSSLSLSVLIRPTSDQERQWLTLIAALAVVNAAEALGVSAGIKWPNDILVKGKKLCGILASAEQGAVIMGIGVNIRSHPDLIDTAVSLDDLGVTTTIDELAALVGQHLKLLVAEFRANSLPVRQKFQAACLTLGEQVRAEFPDGKTSYGLAREINESGQLVILTPEPMALSAADVWHLRN